MALHVSLKFRCFILLLRVQLVSVEITVAASRPISKPGCKDRCGNVSIPYPFGISDGCFVFMLLDGEMTTEVNIATNCDDQHTAYDHDSMTFLGKFTFPTTNGSISGGCLSICTTKDTFTDGFCNGIGCCETRILAAISNFSATVDDINERKNMSFNLCSYGFLSYLKDFKSKGTGTVPAVVDWTIGNENCDDAIRNSTSYACVPNTVCKSGNIVLGYRCKCAEGYAGNPYLASTTAGGCQDIDECEEESGHCGNGFKCINLPGSHICSCDKNIEKSAQGSYFCRTKKRKFPIAVVVPSGIGVSIVIIHLLGMGIWLYKRFEKRQQMKLKQKHFARNGGLLFMKKVTSNDGRVEKAAKIFVAEELEKMTDNFNPSRIIGRGGFGTVFKGMLWNGEIVAIKKSTLVDEKQVDQFINEVVILSQINHRHIVKLLGCCLETQVPLLVYEFVSNGTLSDHLHFEEGDNESLISWKDRVRIASEIAGALAYLHSDASIPIYLRDIKTPNILLDEKYKAKSIDTTHLTTLVQGTFGYLDPEYFHSSQFTDQSDVYSFGIVLLELLTGEMAVSKIRHEAEKSLALYFIKSLKENRLSEILDARVLNEGETDDVLGVAQLAKRCLKYVGKKRPTMKEVSHGLEGLHEKLSKDFAVLCVVQHSS
ncbi:hypothetical protein MKX03_018173 [Papaver bracteatum]|nr:hypothetical protein MKX03_018173 [Papaver bracteatum]